MIDGGTGMTEVEARSPCSTSRMHTSTVRVASGIISLRFFAISRVLIVGTETEIPTPLWFEGL